MKMPTYKWIKDEVTLSLKLLLEHVYTFQEVLLLLQNSENAIVGPQPEKLEKDMLLSFERSLYEIH